MTSAAYDIAQELAGQGIGAFGGAADWCINVSRLPESPDNAIAVYDTGGRDPLEVDEAEMTQPSIQVRVRGLDYAECYAKQAAIYQLLQIPYQVDLGEHRYVAINSVAGILDIGSDDNNRYSLTANYQIIRQPLEV